jgi:hypothetical protein
VRARIGNGAKRGAANIWNIGKPSDKASADSGRNPLWAGAILALSNPSSSLPNAVTAVNLAGPEAKIVTAQRVFHYVTGSK